MDLTGSKENSNNMRTTDIILHTIQVITLAIMIFTISLQIQGCGSCSRSVANITGVSRECVDGIEYLQFPSGVSVAYNQDGSIKQCLKK